MDRPLDPSLVQDRRRRRVAAIGATAGVVVLAVIGLRSVIGPSVDRSRVRVAAVEAGPVDATISATGLVVPEVEQVVTSPVDARVMRIRHRAGDRVTSSEPLMELDLSEARLEVDRLAQDLAIKANDQARRKLTLDRSLIDLDAKAEIKQLQLAQLEAQCARDRQLHKEGLLSDELLHKAELAVGQAKVELKQIAAERANAQASTRAEIEGLALEMAKLRREEAEARRTLDLAAVRSDRDGVLTWVLAQEGTAIRKGEIVARVADFRSFRVDAQVSDVLAPRLSVGLPAIVRLGDETLEGTLSAINPAVVNGVVTVAVTLNERAHPLLRPNLRADVQLVTERKPRTLRVRRGPFATGEGTQPVFVVRGDRAVRTAVRFGVSSADYFEVVNGLSEGDEAIVSDMRDYLSAKELRLR
jgi:HlyD family secretion protein